MVSHGNTESGNLKCGDKSVHPVYLCDEAFELLNRCKEVWLHSEWLFPNRAGKRIYNNRLNEKLKKICNELGIRYRSSHKVRAYAITQVNSSGNIEGARVFAGHTGCSMTQRYIGTEYTVANRASTEALNLGIQTSSDH